MTFFRAAAISITDQGLERAGGKLKMQGGADVRCPPSALPQLVKQRLGFLEIGGIAPFRELIVDLPKQIVR
jgi:hypothetical protein